MRVSTVQRLKKHGASGIRFMHFTTLDEVADDRYVPRNGYVSISVLPLGWLLVLLEEFLQKSPV